ncbi:MAG: hypothetical protein PVG03_18130 [Desulfarculaceae bacterium]|jgi:hypothetical protein
MAVEQQAANSINVWAPLVGVVLGFALGEGARWVRTIYDIKKIKKLIHEELKMVQKQLPIVFGAIQYCKNWALNNKPARGEIGLMCTIGYEHYFPKAYISYTNEERACLTAIYNYIFKIASELKDYPEAVEELLENDDEETIKRERLRYLDFLKGKVQDVSPLLELFVSGKVKECFELLGTPEKSLQTL